MADFGQLHNIESEELLVSYETAAELCSNAVQLRIESQELVWWARQLTQEITEKSSRIKLLLADKVADLA
jgi:hypothetical protein